MRILVCISHVPDTTSKITFSENNTVFNTAGLQYIINPYDEIALSKAVSLSEENPTSTVTVINVGDASTEPTLRKALAVGADDAIRIDAVPRDAWFVAHQLAAYAKAENFDLILTGRESIDYNGGQVAALVGELLSIPSVSIAKSIQLNGRQVSVEREIEGGKEILSASLPLIIGTAEGVAEVKIPNMRGIMSARSKPLQVIPAIDVSVLSEIQTFDSPPPRGAVKLIDADHVEELVTLLHREAKVI